MDPFLNELSGLRAAYTTRAKLVFVPAHAIGRLVGAHRRGAEPSAATPAYSWTAGWHAS